MSTLKKKKNLRARTAILALSNIKVKILAHYARKTPDLARREGSGKPSLWRRRMDHGRLVGGQTRIPTDEPADRRAQANQRQRVSGLGFERRIRIQPASGRSGLSQNRKGSKTDGGNQRDPQSLPRIPSLQIRHAYSSIPHRTRYFLGVVHKLPYLFFRGGGGEQSRL